MKTMRRIFYLAAVVFLVYACSTQKNAVQVSSNEEEITVADSLEYDVETFDGRFDSWYQFYKSPAQYRSQEYYEGWNRQYVNAWNARCASPTRRWQFDPVIGYEPNEDYGFELNHKLFHYFMYVENVLKIRIISNGPHFILR